MKVIAEKLVDVEVKEQERHGGRWQAQGGGTNKSEPWNQYHPLTKAEAKALLDALIQQLTSGELKDRSKAIPKAYSFIEKTGIIEGPPYPIQRFFYQELGSDIRIDLEVQAGMAFVP